MRSDGFDPKLQAALERGKQDIVFFAAYFLGIKLHPGQIRFLRGATGIVNILVPGNRFGKAQPLTSRVLAPTGFKLMGELNKGDEVIAADGSVTRVDGVFPQGNRPIYKLTFSDGSSAEADEEHLWNVQTSSNRFRKNFNEGGKEYPNKRFGEWETLTTKQLLEIDLSRPKQRPTIPMVAPIQFPEQPVEIEPYLLGSLIGDGSLKHGICFTTADTEVLDYMDVDYVHAGKYAYRFRGIAKQLTQLGLRVSSLDKFVPKHYLLNTPKVRLEMLRGLMDTDGCISSGSNVMEFCSISKQLAEDVQFLVQSFGGKARISSRYTFYSHLGEKRRGQLSYRVKIAIPVNPFKLRRKADIYDAFIPGTTQNRILRKIEYVGVKPAQCISIEHPSSLYVTDDFIVTHNTVILAVRHIWHNFYKIGLYEGDGEDWAKAEYKTAALAPSSEVLEVMHRTITQIMSSSFVISREGEPIQTNFCRIQWYTIPSKNRNSAPFFIQFKDNSFIKFHSGSDDKFSSVQGKKYGYGGYDEGGRSYHLRYELKSNLIPRFQELGAPLDLASTPDQQSPSIVYHHEIFQKGKRREEGFVSFEGAADENVYLPQQYFQGLETSYREADGSFDPLYQQVRYGKFVFAGNTLYKSDDIQRAITTDLNGGVRPQPKHAYVIATDTALLTDEMVHTVLDVPEPDGHDVDGKPLVGTAKRPLRLVSQAAATGRSKSPEVHTFDYLNLWDSYNHENLAQGIIECFNSDGIRFWMDLPRHVQRKHKHYAWAGPEGAKVSNTGSNAFKKSDVLIALKKVLTRGGLLLPEDNKELIQQLTMYREDDSKLKTDRVISLALAVWLATEGKPSNQVATAIAIPW